MASMNSTLIKNYQQVDHRFLPLWGSIRHIAKSHGILSGRDGYLSPYAFFMTMITYLQSIPQPILPLLQDRLDYVEKTTTLNGWDCLFDRNWLTYSQVAKKNETGLAGLLRRFCCYFGYVYDYDHFEVNPRLGQVQLRNYMRPWIQGNSGDSLKPR
ncbi:hypothetical protein BGZ83_002030, partial [Gryganskiella cystojenkinii]